jgi:hypothetical protein
MSTPPPDDVQYLDLADYLWLAGAALDRAPEAVFDIADLGLAESALHAPAATYGGVEFYRDLVTKARVLVVHLAKNHPLPRRQQARRVLGHDRIPGPQRTSVHGHRRGRRHRHDGQDRRQRGRTGRD